MEDVYFDAVTFATQTLGRYRTITSVSQAAEQLLYHWPVKGGKKHRAARVACVEALEGVGSADQVRAAFIEACGEAGVFVRE